MFKKLSARVFAMLLVCTVLAGADTTLFYGGDFDYNNPFANGFSNENDGIVGGNPYGSAVFQNFVIPVGRRWAIHGLFSNDLMNISPGQVYWEIRTGVFQGNGGTLLYSGTDTDIVTPTGRSGFGFTEYNNLVSGLNIYLGSGMYWMTVVPLAPGQAGRSFNSNTFGLNSVGEQQSDNQFVNSTFFGVYYQNPDDFGIYPTFSSGVIGLEVGCCGVPEPANLWLLGTALLGIGGIVRHWIRN